MHEPWIPHFGNHIPYTTEAEDKVLHFRKELAKAEKNLGEARWVLVEDEDNYLTACTHGLDC